MKPRVSLIVAMSENRVIGKDGALPWHLPEDLKRFRDRTRGHAVIMGRKTYEAIVEARGGPLPNRKNFVVTRNTSYSVPDEVVLCHSLEDALERARSLEGEELFIIGGSEIFRQAMPIADTLHLTIVHKKYEGDTLFPEHESVFTREISREELEDNGVRLTFLELEKG